MGDFAAGVARVRRRNMMNGGVTGLACRDRLRSHDMKGKKEEVEEGRKMIYYDDEEEKMLDGDNNVKNQKASTGVLEKKREVPNNPSSDEAKAKSKNEKRLHGGDEKAKYRKASNTTSEREEKKRKSASSHGREKKVRSGDHDKDKRRGTPLQLDKNKDRLKEKSREKKVQSGDHDKDKRRDTPLPLDMNKDRLKEKSRKMPSTHSAEKIHKGDHHKDKRKSSSSKSKRYEKEKRKNLSSHYAENKLRSYVRDEHKGRSKPDLLFNSNEIKKKKTTPLDLSKEKKTRIMIDSKEKERKKTHEIFINRKRMRTEDKAEKDRSGDRWKTKNTTQGCYKDQRVQSDKEKRNVSIAFIKIIFNDNFEEFLLIPPVVAAKLTDLTNCRVNLEDSEGKFSKVRLSMIDGSLAFYQGWNDFVSVHSVMLGDVLLFEYTARSQFSVRVFGMDSCERVCFSVERQGGKKQEGCHAPDETENVAKSGNAVSAGSSIAVFDKNEHLANVKHKANDFFQTWGKGRRSSGLILINDDEAPLTQENEDTKKLKALHTASETHCVSASTKEDPKGVLTGALCGPSVAIDNKEGTLAIGECEANCISSICSTGKTTRSEIVPVIDAAPLAQDNDDAVELTTFPLHIEDASMMKESEPEIATPAKCTDIQDSVEDLRRKQEGNTVQLECTTTVDKCPSNSVMNTNGDVRSKHEAPVGSPSLEKWKKATVSGQAALDGTGLIELENLLKSDDKLVGNCSSSRVNSVEQSLQGYAGRAALDGTGLIRPENRLKTDKDLRRKQEGNAVQLECTTAVDKSPSNSKMNTNGSGCSKHEAARGSPSLEKLKKATVSSQAALDGTGLINPEKLLKTDDKLVGNCSATGVNPVEQLLQGYADTHSCVQQTPGKISKFIHIKTKIDPSVHDKGPTVQPRTQMEQFEPMGGIACRQQMNNIPVCADPAVAGLSEDPLFSQEDRKASHHVTPAVLLPVKDEVLELDDHSVLKTNLQFCIPSTTQTWLVLPSSLSNALRRKGRQDRNVVMLKDPMKRLWPVFYHENSLFVGFARGWKPFVAANNVQTGDVCMLLKDMDDDEIVYHVQITRK